jgi:hypothetical protein
MKICDLLLYLMHGESTNSSKLFCVISFLIMRVFDVIILGVYWTGSNWYWIL